MARTTRLAVRFTHHTLTTEKLEQLLEKVGLKDIPLREVAPTQFEVAVSYTREFDLLDAEVKKETGIDLVWTQCYGVSGPDFSSAPV